MLPQTRRRAGGCRGEASLTIVANGIRHSEGTPCLTRGSRSHWRTHRIATPYQSLEAFAAASSNVVVVKSMSKAYALSGVRAAYMCGPPALISEARRWCPPWAVSLPGQIAACKALACLDYYRARWQETAVLRCELQAGLEAQGWEVVPGCANLIAIGMTGRPVLTAARNAPARKGRTSRLARVPSGYNTSDVPFCRNSIMARAQAARDRRDPRSTTRCPDFLMMSPSSGRVAAM